MKNNKEVNLTIFTPTYNRANTLPRVFESLEIQTLKNFEWLIIDDGSTDNTEEVVNSFYSKASFPIRYVKQENAGKQAAWNKAVGLANGRYFCGLDSDDALYSKDNVNEIFDRYINLLQDSEVAGLRFLAFSNIQNDFHGKQLSDDVIICSWFDEFKDAKNFGERIDVFKTDILKNFLYPVTNKTKFIPEIWFYSKISAAKYKFAYIPLPLRMFYDDATNNRLGRSELAKHAQGHYISRATMLKEIPTDVFLSTPTAWAKSIVRFGQCANLLNVSFDKRVKDTNLGYGVFSYMFGFIK